MVNPCRICGAEGTFRVLMDAGCVCFPDDREQWLCWQHLDRSTPLGTFEVVEGPDLPLFAAQT